MVTAPRWIARAAAVRTRSFISPPQSVSSSLRRFAQAPFVAFNFMCGDSWWTRSTLFFGRLRLPQPVRARCSEPLLHRGFVAPAHVRRVGGRSGEVRSQVSRICAGPGCNPAPMVTRSADVLPKTPGTVALEDEPQQAAASSFGGPTQFLTTDVSENTAHQNTGGRFDDQSCAASARPYLVLLTGRRAIAGELVAP